MDPENPYGKYVEERDPVALMGQTPDRIKALADSWPSERFRQSYAPGKWEARQIFLHLARTALETYYALRQLNVACARQLTPEQRAKRFTRPERGAISVNWLLVMLAGHDIHHLRQLEMI